MKVMCINDKNKPVDYEGDWVKEGDIYTVINTVMPTPKIPVMGYELLEAKPKLFGKYGCFASKRFKVVSDDDILKLALQRQIQKFQSKPMPLPKRIKRELEELELI